MRPFNSPKVLLSALAGCAFSLLVASCASAQPQPENIALGKSVSFSNAPNYGLTTDPDDKIQLTDGKFMGESTIWFLKGTVGWSNVMPVVITIDLGSVQPISGVVYSTGAGKSGVKWPNTIYIATSDDNKTWYSAGDLIALSKKNGTPPADGYASFKYETHDLKTKGRYISFVVVQMPLAFVDEIEVYKGSDAWLHKPISGQATTSLKEMLPTIFAQRRLNDDITTIRAEVMKSNLPANRKRIFNTRLDEAAQATAQMPVVPTDVKTILPLNATHRDILAIRGELLEEEGLKPLTIWKQHRYAWIPFLANPDTQKKPQLSYSMLRNQFRSDALLLTNASGKSQKVTLRLNKMPRGLENKWLQVYSVVWTDTAQGTPVADALMPVTPQDGSYIVDVPAGMTRKVWLTVDSSKIAPGSYKSTFEVNGASVPLSIDVSKVVMSKPRLSLGMWDYTNVPGAYGMTAENQQAAIALMRSHYVDSPWATSSALPRPASDAFDAQGNLIGKLDFSNFDNWVAMWPDARNYFVFANAPDSFAGSQMGTPLFDAKVGSWAKTLSSHMKSLGLKPSQLGILLVDEPKSDAQDAIIAAWAKAMNATASELTLFENPLWLRPDQTKIQEAITVADILCLHRPNYNSGDIPVQNYFEKLRKGGKKLWLYQATGPIRTFDPQLSYRYQAWQVFSIKGLGQGFWSFGDTGGAPTSWNGYSVKGYDFAPAFIDKDTVYDSVHWDAVREGVEDFEELSMLQDAINASTDINWNAQAKNILNNAVTTITKTWTLDYTWWKDRNDPGLADAQLQKVREMLEK